MASFPYTAKDFNSIKAQMVARIPALAPQWTDFNASDPGMTLLELFAGAADTIAYSCDAAAGEAFLATAQQRQNVINLCALIGYQLSGPVAATTTIRFSIPMAVSHDIVIPSRTECVARSPLNVGFATTAPITIRAGQLSGDGPAVQGGVKTATFTADGGARQEYQIANPNIDMRFFDVWVDGNQYDVVPDFIDSAAGSADFTVSRDADGYTHIRFGDGTNGACPPTGSPIVITYLETLGAAGNMGRNVITDLVSSVAYNGAPINVTLTNQVASTGGADAETIDHALVQIGRAHV